MTEAKAAPPELCAAHAHCWGKPFTDSLEIAPLSDAQRKLLVEAGQPFDVRMLMKQGSVFRPICDQLDRCFSREDRGVKWSESGVFVRLSTVSPKDVVAEDTEAKTKQPAPTDADVLDPKKLQRAVFPSLKCHSTVQVLARLVRSARILDEIDDCSEEDRGRFAIVLKAWDTRIRSEREYRCLIYERKLEAIIHESAKELTASDRKCIETWVSAHVARFPEPTLALDLALMDEPMEKTTETTDSKKTDTDRVIFVEFNTLDKELDTFGVDLDGLSLSADCRARLHQRGNSDRESDAEAEDD